MQYYTYILQSQKDGRFYIGQTQDVSKRLERHNAGSENYTSKFMPWKIVWFKTFDDRKKSYKLEQILKKLKSRKGLIKYIRENPIPGSESQQISDLHDFRESS